jgi:hypothetical protein
MPALGEKTKHEAGTVARGLREKGIAPGQHAPRRQRERDARQDGLPLAFIVEVVDLSMLAPAPIEAPVQRMSRSAPR